MEDKRLNELLKQRALIEEHLIWLDAKIDAAQNQYLIPTTSNVPVNRFADIDTNVGPQLDLVPSVDPDPTLVISDIYDELGPATKDSAKEARKGCLAFFAIAFLAFAALAFWVSFKY